VVLDSKIEMINNCTENIAQNIEDRNLNNGEDTSFHSNLACWLILDVDNLSNQLMYSPDRETLKKLFEDLISKSVIKICAKHKHMIKLEEIQKFIISDGEHLSGEEQIGLQELIFNDKNFKNHQVQVKINLDIAFDYVEKYAAFLIPFIKKYEDTISLDMEEF